MTDKSKEVEILTAALDEACVMLSKYYVVGYYLVGGEEVKEIEEMRKKWKESLIREAEEKVKRG